MRSKLEIISMQESDRILSILDCSGAIDTFYHPSFVRILMNYDFDAANFLHFRSDDGYIIEPVLIKEIPDNPGIFDLHSPWFYGGPLFCFEDRTKIESNFEDYRQHFARYCKEHGIISDFRRFHPILTSDIIPLITRNNIFFEKKIIYVDLNKTIDEIYDKYSKKIKKGIRRAERNDMEYVISKNTEYDMNLFKERYRERMKDLDASNFYQFDDAFFDDLIELFKNNIGIFFVKKDDEIIAGKLSIFHNGFLNGFLGFSDPEYNKYRVNDFFYHKMNEWAKEMGFRYYVLGGGKTNSEKDGLYRYKIQFSQDTFDQYCTKNIYDDVRYTEICNQRNIDSIQGPEASFFPEYRKPI